MKIGIITYHFCENYGAVLQCYALQEYLKSLGNKVEIINYIDEKQERNRSLFRKRKGISNFMYNICLFPFIIYRMKKHKKFKDFANVNLNCSSRISNLQELEKYINSNNFDYIISGSDQVWNPNIKDFSEAFYLPVKINCNKATYAASLGNASLEKIKKYDKEINDFKYISVREKNAINILSNITKKEMTEVNDPVMLLDLQQWERMSVNSNIKRAKKKYLLCYFLHKKYLDKEYKVAKKIAKEKNLKLILINANFSKESLYINSIKDVGPIDFVDLFKNADFICTDSFHGTIFSIILEKEFLVFTSKNEKKDTRRENVLNSVKLESRLINIDDYKNIDTNKINYNEVREYLEKNAEKGKKFLELIQNDR